VNTAAVNMGVQVSLLFANLYSFEHMVRTGTAGSYSRSIFSFLRNLHADCHSGWTSLHPTYSVPFLPHILTSICYCLFSPW
jgi:hypothetical protein